jgi:two-component system, OmpR family, sensor kinase
MSRWTLRTQVAIAAAAAIFVAVALLGAALQVLLGRELHAQIDQNLRQRAADISALSASAPALLTAPGALDSSATAAGLQVEVLDRRGGIVARSLALGAQALPIADLAGPTIATGKPRWASAHLGDTPIRLYAAPLPDVGGPASGGAVVVASSTEQVEATLHKLRGLTLLSGIAAALSAAALALLITRRVLAPLTRLTRDATEVRRAADPSLRLDDTGRRDEVGRLAEALNGMLAALEHARNTERRFLADASHELRTPLTALRGNAHHLATRGPDPELARDLEQDIARLSRLVDTLLALAREDAASPPEGVVDLERLVTSMDGDSRVLVEAESPLAVRGDADAIRRAIANLLENARRYGPDGAPIELRARTIDGEAAISVRDRGSGIPGAALDEATTRFWRGSNAAGTEGSGLGLALVRATAERHGGRLEIDGPTFTMFLPALTDLSESDAYTSDESRSERPM